MNFRFRLASHCSSVSSSSRPPGELPAQVTSTSIAPNRSSVASTVRSTSSITLMSPAKPTTSPPVSSHSSRAASSRRSASRAVMATRQPSRASCRATSRPMPMLAPVTNAALPCSPRSIYSSFSRSIAKSTRSARRTLPVAAAGSASTA